MTGAAAQALLVGARRAFDEHLDGAADEALRALAGPALDYLEQPLHALHLDRVRHEALGHARPPSASAGENRNVKALS